MKVLLIMVDGMRPDALSRIPEVENVKKRATYTLAGRAVLPSVTLPCHMSLFHSVDPMRHGTTTNTYAPQVRPIEGLCEALHKAGKSCAFFYSWAELRDLARPGSLEFSFFVDGHSKRIPCDSIPQRVTAAAISHLENDRSDFVFAYLGWPDSRGHQYGWMSEEYLQAVQGCWDCITQLINAAGEDYSVIITADHGGHGRIHGTELPEDMTIPMFFYGPDFSAGKALPTVHITDIAPTITALLGVPAPADWEGNSLL